MNLNKVFTGILTVTPDPVAPGGSFSVSGTGFNRNSTVRLFVLGSGCVLVGDVPTDEAGSFSGADGVTSLAGSYHVEVIDPNDARTGLNAVIAAQSFDVA